MNSKTFFSEIEHKKIEETIRRVETKTSGEVVAMITNQSEDYIEIDVMISFVVALIFSLLTLYFLPDILYLINTSIITKIISLPYQFKDMFRYVLLYGVYFFIPLCIFYIVLVKLFLSKFPMIKGILVSKFNKSEAVRNRALRAFYEHGLYNTRDKTGILFLISLIEKQVYILADKGIYEKITQENLDKYAEIVVSGIKQKKASEALCTAISSCGEILEKNFPIKSDDTNELSNHVIIE